MIESLFLIALLAAPSTAANPEPFHLEIVWSRTLGSGYSGIALREGRLFTGFATDESDVLVSMDAGTGQEHWRYRIGERFAARGGSAGGPAGTPVVAGGVVYGLGPRGKLFALDQRDGTEIWSLRLDEAFGATAPYYGFAGSLVVAGDILFVQAGGSHGRSLVGLDRKTGKVRWTTADDAVAYQSPVLARLAGRVQIVAATKERVLGLDPGSGRPLWEREHGVGGAQGAGTVVVVGSDRFILAGTNNVAMFRIQRDED